MLINSFVHFLWRKENEPKENAALHFILKSNGRRSVHPWTPGVMGLTGLTGAVGGGYILLRIDLATCTPLALAWERPRVTPAPSPMAKMFLCSVSRSLVSTTREL